MKKLSIKAEQNVIRFAECILKPSFCLCRVEDEAVLDRGASFVKHVCDEEEVEGKISDEILRTYPFISCVRVQIHLVSVENQTYYVR